jgi:ATP-dependent helicase/nuclease subunit A
VKLADQPARDRIATALDVNLIVEAAAGTGKTTELVRRIVAVVASGKTTLDRIVAVTFTEKAAGELKLRVRQEIEDRRRKSVDSAERLRLEGALEKLEEARISTIHSFCRDLLVERPVEAGIDPLFEVAAQEEADAMLRAAFERWFEHALQAPGPALKRILARADHGLGESPTELLFNSALELSRWRDFPAQWSRPAFDREAELETLFTEMVELGALADFGSPGDWLYESLAKIRLIAREAVRLEKIRGLDLDAREAALMKLLRGGQNHWNWKGYGGDFGPHSRAAVLQRRAQFHERLKSLSLRLGADLAPLLREELRAVIDRFQELKRRAGKLDFIDLLWFTRDLIRDCDAVRAELQQRFTHIFVDEFQDTDPLQAEIILLLAADDPGLRDFRQVRPVPGKLFIVGDPKQSIYRFRRADLALYQRIKAQLLRNGAELEHLTVSFRARPELQVMVNSAIAPLMVESETQARYQPLEPVREDLPQPPVIALPVPKPYGRFGKVTKFAIEESLPKVVGAFVQWLVRESGWKVTESNKPAELVSIEPRHVCILFRRMTNFRTDVARDYARELEVRHIPHVLVKGSSFQEREEIEAMRNALNAIERPDDELSVYATLRGPLFAFSDGELLIYKETIGTLHPFRRIGEKKDPSIARITEALEILRDLHRCRNRHPVADTIARLLQATRAHAGFAVWPTGEQALANLSRLIDQARRFESRGGTSFRSFIDQLDRQADAGSFPEAPLVEEGTEGVRLMTVHGAKGLEFPIVILADITCNEIREEVQFHIDSDRGLCAVRIAGCAPQELLEHSEEELRREREEARRILYVAVTRARDLLVVPVVGDERCDGWVAKLADALYPHPSKRRSPVQPVPGCPAFGDDSVVERPPKAPAKAKSVMPGLHSPLVGAHRVVWWDPSRLNLEVDESLGLRQDRLLAADESGAVSQQGVQAYEAWLADRERLLRQGSAPLRRLHSVTELARLAADGKLEVPEAAEIEIEEVAREPGRPTGARFGILVHAILMSLPPQAAGGAIAGFAALHGRILGTSEAEISAAIEVVENALRSPLMQRAAGAAEIRRESPLLIKLEDGSMVEGVADLAFKQGESWTVVDFKTDFELARRLQEYRAQLGLYLRGIRASTGAPARGSLLWL